MSLEIKILWESGGWLLVIRLDLGGVVLLLCVEGNHHHHHSSRVEGEGLLGSSLLVGRLFGFEGFRFLFLFLFFLEGWTIPLPPLALGHRLYIMHSRSLSYSSLSLIRQTEPHSMNTHLTYIYAHTHMYVQGLSPMLNPNRDKRIGYLANLTLE